MTLNKGGTLLVLYAFTFLLLVFKSPDKLLVNGKDAKNGKSLSTDSKYSRIYSNGNKKKEKGEEGNKYMAVSFINGIYHSEDDVKEITAWLEEKFQSDIHYFYNPTSGNWVKDATKAGFELVLKPQDLDISKGLAKHLRSVLGKVSPKGRILHIAHSGGAILTYLAAKFHLTYSEKERIDLVTIGGGRSITKKYFKGRICNYYARNDHILMVEKRAAKLMKRTTNTTWEEIRDEKHNTTFVFLRGVTNDPIRDHSMTGPTYRKALSIEAQHYRNQLRKYIEAEAKEKDVVRIMRKMAANVTGLHHFWNLKNNSYLNRDYSFTKMTRNIRKSAANYTNIHGLFSRKYSRKISDAEIINEVNLTNQGSRAVDNAVKHQISSYMDNNINNNNNHNHSNNSQSSSKLNITALRSTWVSNVLPLSSNYIPSNTIDDDCSNCIIAINTTKSINSSKTSTDSSKCDISSETGRRSEQPSKQVSSFSWVEEYINETVKNICKYASDMTGFFSYERTICDNDDDVGGGSSGGNSHNTSTSSSSSSVVEMMDDNTTTSSISNSTTSSNCSAYENSILLSSFLSKNSSAKGDYNTSSINHIDSRIFRPISPPTTATATNTTSNDNIIVTKQEQQQALEDDCQSSYNNIMFNNNRKNDNDDPKVIQRFQSDDPIAVFDHSNKINNNSSLQRKNIDSGNATAAAAAGVAYGGLFQGSRLKLNKDYDKALLDIYVPNVLPTQSPFSNVASSSTTAAIKNDKSINDSSSPIMAITTDSKTEENSSNSPPTSSSGCSKFVSTDAKNDITNMEYASTVVTSKDHHHRQQQQQKEEEEDLLEEMYNRILFEQSQ